MGSYKEKSVSYPVRVTRATAGRGAVSVVDVVLVAARTQHGASRDGLAVCVGAGLSEEFQKSS